jgi:hypothetical protein
MTERVAPRLDKAHVVPCRSLASAGVWQGALFPGCVTEQKIRVASDE